MLLGPSPSGGPSSAGDLKPPVATRHEPLFTSKSLPACLDRCKVGRTDSPARRARPPIPDRLKQRSFPGFLEWGSWFHVRCHLTLLYWLHVIQTRNP